ncbi:MAG: MBOAT family O-acyltransferase [Myxococcota bacterium]
MLFNSLAFCCFLSVVYVLYFSLPRIQLMTLLLSGLLFYGWWNPPYLLLFLFTVGLDFIVGAKAAPSAGGHRKAWLVASIIANLSILGTFKYYNFFVHSAAEGLASLGIPWTPPAFTLLLPMGISFYTFQSMAYTIDCYRGTCKPIARFDRFLLFVSFFPHLVAGPIMRPENLVPQFRDGVRFRADWMALGAVQIARGYAKKLFIADGLAPYVNRVFTHPEQFSQAQLLVAVYAFAVQIYCDFSGYSDIAIGLGRTLGYTIPINFQHPYQSLSVTEFWRRWHISLSSWLRDYLYVPLGGSRSGPKRTYVNLMLTMVLGGLWHGAAFNFIVWGTIHGAMLAIERWLGVSATARADLPLWQVWVRRLVVFHLVCVAWVFFRAETFSGAVAVLRGIFGGTSSGGAVSIMVLGWIAVFFVCHEVSRRVDWLKLSRHPLALGLSLSLLVVSVLVMFRRIPSEFIYFQF